MKKTILLFLASLLLTSCMTHEVLFINKPAFCAVPIIEDDSVRIEFLYLQPLSINISIKNKTTRPIQVIWDETYIDGMEAGFSIADSYLERQPETIRPNWTVRRKMAIRKYIGSPALIGFFENYGTDTWGYYSRNIALTIAFGDELKYYYVELAKTKTRKRRLKEPPSLWKDEP